MADSPALVFDVLFFLLAAVMILCLLPRLGIPTPTMRFRCAYLAAAAALVVLQDLHLISPTMGLLGTVVVVVAYLVSPRGLWR